MVWTGTPILYVFHKVMKAYNLDFDLISTPTRNGEDMFKVIEGNNWTNEWIKYRAVDIMNHWSYKNDTKIYKRNFIAEAEVNIIWYDTVMQEPKGLCCSYKWLNEANESLIFGKTRTF